jgi:hypothetical protein
MERPTGGDGLTVFASTEGEPPLLGYVAGLLAIPALVVLNGLFVAAEFALVSVRKTRVEEMVGKGVAGARAVEAALASSASRRWPPCSGTGRTTCPRAGAAR